MNRTQAEPVAHNLNESHIISTDRTQTEPVAHKIDGSHMGRAWATRFSMAC